MEISAAVERGRERNIKRNPEGINYRVGEGRGGGLEGFAGRMGKESSGGLRGFGGFWRLKVKFWGFLEGF